MVQNFQEAHSGFYQQVLLHRLILYPQGVWVNIPRRPLLGEPVNNISKKAKISSTKGFTVHRVLPPQKKMWVGAKILKNFPVGEKRHLDA